MIIVEGCLIFCPSKKPSPCWNITTARRFRRYEPTLCLCASVHLMIAPQKKTIFLNTSSFLWEEVGIVIGVVNGQWSYYSLHNTVMKYRYNAPLQKYPRITTFLTSFSDIQKKSSIFEYEGTSDRKLYELAARFTTSQQKTTWITSVKSLAERSESTTTTTKLPGIDGLIYHENICILVAISVFSQWLIIKVYIFVCC